MSEKEYNECVNEYSEKLFKYIVKNISESETAKDLTQDAFLSLWAKHKTVQMSKAKAFLFISAHNSIVNHLRRAKNQCTIRNDLSQRPEPITENAFEKCDLVNKVIERLPQMMKEAVVLRDVQGFSYKEIAEILQLTETNVKTIVFRAKVMLKKMLNGEL